MLRPEAPPTRVFGSQTFGKAIINCKSLDRVFNWDLMDGERTGLVILKVIIAELADCKLKDATIHVGFGTVDTTTIYVSNFLYVGIL